MFPYRNLRTAATKQEGTLFSFYSFLLRLSVLLCGIWGKFMKCQKLYTTIINQPGSKCTQYFDFCVDCSEWILLFFERNSSSLQSWLTPLDICMLKANRPDIDLKQYRSHNCSKFPSDGISTHRLFCNIGSSLGKPCSPPLSGSSRKFFTARLKNHRYGDPSDRYLNMAVERLAK